MKKDLSLRERAVAALARREYTRAELARKLGPHAEDPQELAALLDELVRRKLLSDERYAEARAHALGRKYGSARIAHELKHRGVPQATVDRIVGEARQSDLDRARAAWNKRFDGPPGSPEERAKQMRFLQSRGFSFEVIRRVVGGEEEE